MAAAASQSRFNPLPAVQPSPSDTALIVIDMQYRSAHPDYSWAKKAKDEGRLEVYASFFARLPMIVANIQRVQRVCRASGIEVLFLVNQSWSQDGRELSPGYKTKGYKLSPGSKDVQILDELKPIGDEIVLNKLSTSAFTTSPVDAVLRNMGIRKLLVAGVNTNYCVESFIRAAFDLGYEVVLLEDCCGTVQEQHHEATCKSIDNIFCKVNSSNDIIAAIQGGARQRMQA